MMRLTNSEDQIAQFHAIMDIYEAMTKEDADGEAGIDPKGWDEKALAAVLGVITRGGIIGLERGGPISRQDLSVAMMFAGVCLGIRMHEAQVKHS